MKNNWLRNVLIVIVVLLLIGGITFLNLQFFKKFDSSYLDEATKENSKVTDKKKEKVDKKSSTKEDKHITSDKKSTTTKAEKQENNSTLEATYKKINCQAHRFSSTDPKESVEAYFENDALIKIKLSETEILETSNAQEIIDIMSESLKKLNNVSGFKIELDAPSATEVKTIVSIEYKKLDEKKFKELYEDDSEEIIKYKNMSFAKFEEEFKNQSYFCNTVEA